MSTSELRVTAYTWDHKGLGHINRTLGVLQGLKEAEGSLEALILAEQESPLLRAAEWPYVCVPLFGGCFKGAREKARSASSHSAVKAAMAYAQATTAVESFRPNLILQDTVLWSPLFDAAVSHSIPQILVVRHRKDLWQFLQGIQAELEQVAAIILPHNTEDIEEAEFPASLRHKLHFSGPILRPVDDRSETHQALRQKYGIEPGKRTVVITAGGGGFEINQHFFQMVTEALAEATTYPTHVVIVTGPFYEGTISLPEATHLTWSLTSFEAHLPALLAIADLAVSQVGDNSANEIATLQTPTLLVPAPREFDDQERRARQMLAPHIRIATMDKARLREALRLMVLERPAYNAVLSREHAFASLGRSRSADIILSALKRPQTQLVPAR